MSRPFQWALWVCVVPLLLVLSADAQERKRSSPDIARVLDDWHAAAAAADEARYFGHLSKDAVFMGTDATERWSKEAFRAYAKPHFAKGKAWTFKAKERTVTLGPSGDVAWFDEELVTENLGPSRGSGVLVKEGGKWLIAQYNLSVPIPNAVFKEVKGVIARHLESAGTGKGGVDTGGIATDAGRKHAR